MAFCSNCGENLNDGAKFCHGCGVQVGGVTPPENKTQRQQEYVGKVYKCPNCGMVIDRMAAICSGCGMKISGGNANRAVQKFKDELMEIEKSRKAKGVAGSLFSMLQCDPADMQKLTLVKNFPVSNDVEEISEFILLAIANIDVSLSKNNLYSRYSSSVGVNPQTIDRFISNAWVSKMEQMYKKAEISFPNDPAFLSVQQTYLDKMKKLKIKVD